MTHTLTQIFTWTDDGTLCRTDAIPQPGTAADARTNRVRRLKEQRTPYTEADGVVSIPGEPLTTTLTWEDQP